MKIVLAGSPQISVKTFQNIIDHFEVIAIITQPDRKKGRGQKLMQTAVSELAVKNNIKLFKPEKISLITNDLKNLDYDILISFAYGQIIPQEILSLGKYPPVNIHGSLLPKYRGAAPIQKAILEGVKEIGITLIEMINKMDAGDMFFKASTPIDETTTTGDGFEIISNLASEHIVKWIHAIEKDEVSPEPQGENYSLASKINKQDAEILESMSMKKVKRMIKAYNPFPGAYFIKNGKRIKFFNYSHDFKEGMVTLNLNDGNLFVSDFQYEGKTRQIVK